MSRNRKLLALATALIVCAALVWSSTSIRGGEKTYEIQPYISVPEYRTDAARAIDAYERLMDRYMDLTEGNFTRIGVDVRDILRKLDSMDAKLTGLCQRIAGIENALGIEQPKWQTRQNTQPKALDKKHPAQSSPAPEE